MKRTLFLTGIHSGITHFSLLLLRLAAGGFMLTHGWPKLQRLLAGDMKFGDPLGLGPEVSLVLVVFSEFVCSILIMLGLGTRLASVPLIVTMAVAAFIAHADDPFQRKELALFYLVVFVVLLLSGSGKYSVDHFLQKKRYSLGTFGHPSSVTGLLSSVTGHRSPVIPAPARKVRRGSPVICHPSPVF